jgi:hypothetical protein
MTVKTALGALAVVAALAIGAPAFAQDNDTNAPAAPAADNAPPAMHHTMHHKMMHHHAMHHAHHTMHHAMHHKSHAMHHAAAHHAMHHEMHHGMSGNQNDSERAETRKLNEQQLHQQ